MITFYKGENMNIASILNSIRKEEGNLQPNEFVETLKDVREIVGNYLISEDINKKLSDIFETQSILLNMGIISMEIIVDNYEKENGIEKTGVVIKPLIKYLDRIAIEEFDSVVAFFEKCNVNWNQIDKITSLEEIAKLNDIPVEEIYENFVEYIVLLKIIENENRYYCKMLMQ